MPFFGIGQVLGESYSSPEMGLARVFQMLGQARGELLINEYLFIVHQSLRALTACQVFCFGLSLTGFNPVLFSCGKWITFPS